MFRKFFNNLKNDSIKCSKTSTNMSKLNEDASKISNLFLKQYEFYL